MFGCVLFFFSGFLFFLFSTQNQVPQIIIGIGQMVYHIEAFLVLIRTTLTKFERFFTVSTTKV